MIVIYFSIYFPQERLKLSVARSVKQPSSPVHTVPLNIHIEVQVLVLMPSCTDLTLEREREDGQSPRSLAQVLDRLQNNELICHNMTVI